MRNPFQSTGWVIRSDDRGRPGFVGTCFSFRDHAHLLTAAHCIEGAAVDDITVSIWTDKVEHGLRVKRVTRHPAADLAILEIADWKQVFDPFLGETPLY